MAPGEFKPRLSAPAEVTTHAARDLQPRPVDPAKDRLNAEAVVGAATGLGVRLADGKEVGGELILIQVSSLNGPAGLTVRCPRYEHRDVRSEAVAGVWSPAYGKWAVRRSRRPRRPVAPRCGRHSITGRSSESLRSSVNR